MMREGMNVRVFDESRTGELGWSDTNCWGVTARDRENKVGRLRSVSRKKGGYGKGRV